MASAVWTSTIISQNRLVNVYHFIFHCKHWYLEINSSTILTFCSSNKLFWLIKMNKQNLLCHNLNDCHRLWFTNRQVLRALCLNGTRNPCLSRPRPAWLCRFDHKINIYHMKFRGISWFKVKFQAVESCEQCVCPFLPACANVVHGYDVLCSFERERPSLSCNFRVVEVWLGYQLGRQANWTESDRIELYEL